MCYPETTAHKCNKELLGLYAQQKVKFHKTTGVKTIWLTQIHIKITTIKISGIDTPYSLKNLLSIMS
jgi:hypothetical protein